MKKFLIATAGAMLFVASAGSAFAQPYYGGWGYRNGPGSYEDYVRQLRACRQHARLHAELDVEHAAEHQEGFDSRADHHDLHEDLEAAHEAYHEDHPRADVCDSMMRGSRYAPAYRYGYPSGGYGYGYAPSNYQGLSFGLSFGR